MWVLSGFADEIDPCPETRCAVPDDLGPRYVRLRSARATAVRPTLDLEGVSHR